MTDTAAARPANLFPVLDRADLGTVLAALRYWQAQGMGDPDNRSDDLHELATEGGDQISLDADGIDALCVRINCADASPAAALKSMLEGGFTTGEAQQVINDHADEPGHEAYRGAVPAKDGELECDENAIVSISSDGGAYVATWTWVYDEDAGVERPDSDEEEEDEAEEEESLDDQVRALQAMDDARKRGAIWRQSKSRTETATDSVETEEDRLRAIDDAGMPGGFN